MKTLVLEQPGEEPSLALREVEPPSLGPHDTLVRVAACGVCHHDVAVMRGILRRGVKPDIVLGHEISGHVAKVGNSVSLVKLGDPVVTTLTTSCGRCQRCLDGKQYRCFEGKGIGHAIDGGFAELLKLPETSLVRLPDAIDIVEASIFGCPMGVALQALQDVAHVREGETVLVTGAGGGLGVHSAQIAAALGAKVMSVTSSSGKVERLESLASRDVVLADQLDFSEIVLALTEDRGVDLVVNTVGSALFDGCLRSLGHFGRMLILGEVTRDRAQVSLPELLFRDATILSSTGAERRHIAKVVEMVGSGLLKPVVSRRFALGEALSAYRLIHARESFGRVVLVP